MVGWFNYAEATTREYNGGDWGVACFLKKHEGKWISYKNPSHEFNTPALYLIRLWQADALNSAKAPAWNFEGNYYEGIAHFGTQILLSEDYPLCQEYLDIWNQLNDN